MPLHNNAAHPVIYKRGKCYSHVENTYMMLLFHKGGD